MKRFTITISGNGDTTKAREAAQRLVRSLEAQKDNDNKPVHDVKQAIFNCDNPEDQLDMLFDRHMKARNAELEANNLDARGANKT